MVPSHYWAHGSQSATGGPGPKRASTYFGPLSISNFINKYNQLHANELFVCSSISITSIIGGIGGSDFLSAQISASSKQISFSLVFFRMRVSGSRHLYGLLVVSLGIIYYY